MKKGKVSKEEAKKIKQEQEAQIKRDFLKRETDYGQSNLDKQTRKWSKMVNEISCEHLKAEVLVAWHHFNKFLDYKEIEISMYLDCIEDENLRYWMTLRNHNHLIEYMITYFHRGYKWIYNELGNQVNTLIAHWVVDYDQNKTRSSMNEEYLETMKYQMNCLKKVEEYETITKNFSILNEKTTRYKVLIGDINYSLSDKFENLHLKTKEFTSDYFASIRKKQKAGADSLDRFELLQKDIVANNKKRNKLEKLIRCLLKKYKRLLSTNELKLDELTKERDFLHQCFLIFRENLFFDKNNDTFKRRVLTVSSNDSFEELEKIARKGSIMLKCLSACRKYETVDEKVLPYREEIEVIDKHNDSRHRDLRKELCLFWNRVASADAKRYTLNEERIYLQHENKKLKKQIHNYCKCLDCPSLPLIPQRAGKIPYTEGREMVQKQKTQNEKRSTVSGSIPPIR